jgi:hypothetical protein
MTFASDEHYLLETSIFAFITKKFLCLFFFIVANNYLSLSLSLSLYIYIYIYEYFLLSSYSLTSFSSLFCCPL